MYDFEERVKHIVDNIDKVTLGKPSPASSSGGRQLSNKYVTPILFDGKPLTIQLPLCTTKNGVINNTTKTYTDLVFVNEEKCTTNSVTRLIYTLENTFCKLLYENRVTLFASPNLTMDDFEEMLTTSVRLNRQGDVMLRTTIETLRKTLTGLKTKCDIYTDLGESLTLADIKEGVSIVPLITIKELAFSTTSFNLVIVMTECLVMSKCEEQESKTTPEKRRIVFNENLTPDTFVMSAKQKNINDQKPNKSVKETESAESVILTVTDDVTKQSANEEDVMDELSEVDITLEADDEDINSVVTDDNSGDHEYCDERQDDKNIIQECDTFAHDILGNTNNDTDINANDTNADINNDTNLDSHENNDDRKAHDIREDNEESDYDGLYEVKSLNIEDEGEITLKRPDEVYREIYRVAITKAKKLRKIALQAYMDAKKIKARFLVDTLEDSDDESFQEYEEEE